MDDDLRNGLWNALHIAFWRYLPSYNTTIAEDFLAATWAGFLKRPVDEIGKYRAALDELRAQFFSWPWNRVYDYVEWAGSYAPVAERNQLAFIDSCNQILEQELAGYRFVDLLLIPIGSEEELAAIVQAREDAQPYRTVRTHLNRAAELFADRSNPDPRNSIKESISAVEAACQQLTGSAQSLGQCLDSLAARVTLHPALRGSLDRLYGWTSNAEGIRHALMDDPNLDMDDARFMLVSL